jgi:hypothetical protein
MFIILFGVMGCRPSIPTDLQARQLVVDSSTFFTQAGANMIDFRKLNGVPGEVNGQKIYEYDFLVAFKLSDGLAWKSAGWASPGSGFVKYPGYDNDMFGTHYAKISKGDIAAVRGKIMFKLTEKGWISNDLPNVVQTAGWCTPPDNISPESCYAGLKLNNLNF